MDTKVLFVDDEPNVLSAIRRMLIDEEYETCFANSGAEALELLAKSPVQVIVSDMRMPLMNGVEFLKKALTLQPDSIRMVLSGQADLTTIIESINEAGIWRFINKPWNDHDLKISINNALELFKSNQERRELLGELAVKNKELATINNELERKVLERTKLITAQNHLLNLRVGSAEISVFLRESCKTITNLINSDRVFLFEKDIGECFFLGEGPLACQLEILKSVSLSGQFMVQEKTIAIPLVLGDMVFGACLIEGISKENSKLRDAIQKNIIPIISITLAQNKHLFDAPGLIEELDSLIENL